MRGTKAKNKDKSNNSNIDTLESIAIKGKVVEDREMGWDVSCDEMLKKMEKYLLADPYDYVKELITAELAKNPSKINISTNPWSFELSDNSEGYTSAEINTLISQMFFSDNKLKDYIGLARGMVSALKTGASSVTVETVRDGEKTFFELLSDYTINDTGKVTINKGTRITVKKNSVIGGVLHSAVTLSKSKEYKKVKALCANLRGVPVKLNHKRINDDLELDDIIVSEKYTVGKISMELGVPRTKRVKNVMFLHKNGFFYGVSNTEFSNSLVAIVDNPDFNIDLSGNNVVQDDKLVQAKEAVISCTSKIYKKLLDYLSQEPNDSGNVLGFLTMPGVRREREFIMDIFRNYLFEAYGNQSSFLGKKDDENFLKELFKAPIFETWNEGFQSLESILVKAMHEDKLYIDKYYVSQILDATTPVVIDNDSQRQIIDRVIARGIYKELLPENFTKQEIFNPRIIKVSYIEQKRNNDSRERTMAKKWKISSRDARKRELDQLGWGKYQAKQLKTYCKEVVGKNKEGFSIPIALGALMAIAPVTLGIGMYFGAKYGLYYPLKYGVGVPLKFSYTQVVNAASFSEAQLKRMSNVVAPPLKWTRKKIAGSYKFTTKTTKDVLFATGRFSKNVTVKSFQGINAARLFVQRPVVNATIASGKFVGDIGKIVGQTTYKGLVHTKNFTSNVLKNYAWPAIKYTGIGVGLVIGGPVIITVKGVSIIGEKIHDIDYFKSISETREKKRDDRQQKKKQKLREKEQLKKELEAQLLKEKQNEEKKLNDFRLHVQKLYADNIGIFNAVGIKHETIQTGYVKHSVRKTLITPDNFSYIKLNFANNLVKKWFEQFHKSDSACKNILDATILHSILTKSKEVLKWGYDQKEELTPIYDNSATMNNHSTRAINYDLTSKNNVGDYYSYSWGGGNPNMHMRKINFFNDESLAYKIMNWQLEQMNSSMLQRQKNLVKMYSSKKTTVGDFKSTYQTLEPDMRRDVIKNIFQSEQSNPEIDNFLDEFDHALVDEVGRLSINNQTVNGEGA